jgi:hypothetical protein
LQLSNGIVSEAASVAVVDGQLYVGFMSFAILSIVDSDDVTFDEPITGVPISAEQEQECVRRLDAPSWSETKGGTPVKYNILDEKPPKPETVVSTAFPPLETQERPVIQEDTKDSSSTTGVPRLTILRYSPSGNVETVDRISITFSERMIALGAGYDLLPSQVAVTVTPAVVGGKWTWSDDSTLVYQGENGRRFPYATEFTVRIPADTKSLGLASLPAVLTEECKFSFRTATPQITQAYPRSHTRWHGESRTVVGPNHFQGMSFPVGLFVF